MTERREINSEFYLPRTKCHSKFYTKIYGMKNFILLLTD